MSKTCSTCSHYNNNYPANCLKHNMWIRESQSDLLLCNDHEEKREPLRLECECEWDEWDKHGPVYPMTDCRELDKFIGKRTRMVLEEICDSTGRES